MSAGALGIPARRPRAARYRWRSDERLARMAAAGDERAFEALYDRYHGALYRYCRSIVRHEQDAQDALQATLASAFAGIARRRPDAPVRAWLFRIAHNEAVSLLRRRRPAAPLDEADDAVTASAETTAAQRRRLQTLVADLQDLPERQRAALVMRELSGLGHEDIAAALSMSTGAAKQAIFEARAALAEFGEGRAMRCEEVCRALSDGDRRVLRGRRIRAHLRDCAVCARFDAAIPARRADLAALAPPLPAGIAAGGLLAQLAAQLGAGTAAKTAATSLAAKVAVGGVVLVAAAGTTERIVAPDTAPPPRPAATATSEPPPRSVSAAPARAGTVAAAAPVAASPPAARATAPERRAERRRGAASARGRKRSGRGASRRAARAQRRRAPATPAATRRAATRRAAPASRGRPATTPRAWSSRGPRPARRPARRAARRPARPAPARGAPRRARGAPSVPRGAARRGRAPGREKGPDPGSRGASSR